MGAADGRMSDELRDRHDIEVVLRRYAYGLDERRWDAWEQVFTDDAVIDFTHMGGKVETPAQMSGRLSKPDPAWLFAQHPVYNILIDLDGDRASVFSHYEMETGRRAAEAGRIVRISGGGSYQDELVRSEAGWRIARRSVRMKWKETRTVEDEVARD